jgi:hypothetical protein
MKIYVLSGNPVQKRQFQLRKRDFCFGYFTLVIASPTYCSNTPTRNILIQMCICIFLCIYLCMFVYMLFVVCLLYVCCMFVVCLLYVCCMFVVCLLYVCCMFVVCLLYVRLFICMHK